MTTAYRVRDWDKHFENNRTRDLKKMDWVPVPNRHDGSGFCELMDHPDAMAHYGAWHLILQVASKCGERGTLLREGAGGVKIAHTPQSLARITHGSAAVFEAAIERLVSIGWLEVCTIPAPSCGNPAPRCGEVPMERKGMEGNGRERKGREGKGLDPTPPDRRTPPDEDSDSKPRTPSAKSPDGWTLADCVRAAEGIAMPLAMVEAFYNHYAAVDWIDAAGRKITQLKPALAKWKASQQHRDAETAARSKRRLGDAIPGQAAEPMCNWCGRVVSLCLDSDGCRKEGCKATPPKVTA